jgi:CheY-like chemotaxis protein
MTQEDLQILLVEDNPLDVELTHHALREERRNLWRIANYRHVLVTTFCNS